MSQAIYIVLILLLISFVGCESTYALKELGTATLARVSEMVYTHLTK